VRSTSLSEVLDLFERWGADRYDEEVGQLEHALQTAALAQAAAASDALVAASLLHDVGHLLELAGRAAGVGRPAGDLGHEAVGARYLGDLFPPSVTAPIALHVRAKRYRCAVDARYRDGLSAGSRRSLVRQGGPLPPAEASAFEAQAGFADAVALRGWDDQGKVEGLDVPPLDHYREVLGALART
jgi:phosphonate degradation associated HDIG domain protein